jgi:hypothetical protein
MLPLQPNLPRRAHTAGAGRFGYYVVRCDTFFTTV